MPPTIPKTSRPPHLLNGNNRPDRASSRLRHRLNRWCRQSAEGLSASASAEHQRSARPRIRPLTTPVDLLLPTIPKASRPPHPQNSSNRPEKHQDKKNLGLFVAADNPEGFRPPHPLNGNNRPDPVYACSRIPVELLLPTIPKVSTSSSGEQQQSIGS